MAGNPLRMAGPPVDLDEVELVARVRPNTVRPVTLSQAATIDEFEVGAGEDLKERKLLTTRISATETQTALNKPNEGVVAQLAIRYKTLKLELESNGEKVDVLRRVLPKEVLQLMDANIGLIQGVATVKRNGDIDKTLSDVRAAAPPLRPFFAEFSKEAMEALEQSSVPLPMATVKPGHTWTGPERNVRIVSDFPVAGDGKEKDDQSAYRQGPPTRPKKRTPVVYAFAEQRTYTYQGTRTRNGTKEVVVRITGTVKPSAVGKGGSATGSLKGHAYLDLDTASCSSARCRGTSRLTARPTA